MDPAQCAARASTSGPTPPACWSPTSGRGAHRGAPGARSRASGREGGERLRGKVVAVAGVVAEQRAAAEPRARDACAWSPRRRSAARPTGRSSRPRPRLAGRRGRRARRRGGGAAGVHRRGADARAAAGGRDRGRRRRRRVDRDRRRDAAAAASSGRRRSRSGRACSPTPTCADPPPAAELRALREHARRRSRGSTCPRATPRSRSAAARRRCGGSSGAAIDPEAVQRAMRVLSGAPASVVASRFAPRARARAAAARRADRARRGRARARAPARDRPRRVARGHLLELAQLAGCEAGWHRATIDP